jgi:hypothetical protein
LSCQKLKAVALILEADSIGLLMDAPETSKKQDIQARVAMDKNRRIRDPVVYIRESGLFLLVLMVDGEFDVQMQNVEKCRWQ